MLVLWTVVLIRLFLPPVCLVDGRKVIATGEVDATTHKTSPALSQPAICWTWQFLIRGVSGQTDDRWLVR